MATAFDTLPVDAIDQHHHVCALLASDAEREDLLVEFARPGLERGERVWCVAEDVRETEDVLARGGIGVGDAVAAGRRRSTTRWPTAARASAWPAT